jgi:phospholipid/cholesterol/gamma-HCH transport system substrate-binding protein
MRGNAMQTIMATVVLVVAALFLAFAYSVGGIAPVEGYRVTAAFTDAGGLTAGSDVDLDGVKVGTVSRVAIDPQTEDAVVDMSIGSGIPLPVDSTAAVSSGGLLGGTLIELHAGHSKRMIPPSGAIRQVANYQPLETIVGNMVFSPPGGGPQIGAAP